MRYLITLGGLCIAGWLVSAGPGETPRKENPLMRKKLAAAQKVLEGIAVKDFDMIGANADELILLSKEAEWKALDTSQYTLHSNDFRRNAEELVKTSRDENLDGAALAYLQLTMSCVHCHKHVREVRMALR